MSWEICNKKGYSRFAVIAAAALLMSVSVVQAASPGDTGTGQPVAKKDDVTVVPTGASIAIGNQSIVKGSESIAIGSENLAVGVRNTVIGAHNIYDSGTSIRGTILGTENKVDKSAGFQNTLLGTQNTVNALSAMQQANQGPNTFALNTVAGANNSVHGGGSVVVGFNNQLNYEKSKREAQSLNNAVIVGGESKTSGHFTVTIGSDITNDSNRGVAIGFATQAVTKDSVALGSYSVAVNTLTENTPGAFVHEEVAANSGVVSVGAPTHKILTATYGEVELPDIYRRIVNMAPGVEDHDAVNVSQLKAVASLQETAATQLGTSIQQVDGKVDALVAQFGNAQGQFNAVHDRIDHNERGIASVAALAMLPSRIETGDPYSVAVGMAQYKGRQAWALGLNGKNPRGNVLYRLAVGFGGARDTTVGVGVSYSFGKETKELAGVRSEDWHALKSELADLQKREQEQAQKVQALEAKIASLETLVLALQQEVENKK